jgi:hypothetical protein
MKNFEIEDILFTLFIFILLTVLAIDHRINYDKEQKAKEPESISSFQSEQAMIRLKHEKEKLDYGVITLDRYNHIRDSLALIIK